MQQFPSYWTLNDKVDFLQRKILLNSVAEKQLDIHLLDDEFKNDILHQLIDLQSENTTKTLYGYVFEDFTIDYYPDLYSRLNEQDKKQFDNICRLYNNSASDKMENYYLLEEYINRGED